MPTFISAVIPAYNEAGRIEKTINEISRYVHEIIVVDDASEDATAARAEKAGARVVRLAQNQGYIHAIKCGFQQAQGDIVVTIDADGEVPADMIPQLVQPIIDGKADMVQGHRDLTPRVSERFLTWLAQRKAPVGDSGTGFRALKSDMARDLNIDGVCICGIFSLEVIIRGGDIGEIPVSLRSVDKSRKIAWYHLQQFFYILPWLFKNFE